MESKHIALEQVLYISLVGWSDFYFIAIFENGHIAIDWLYCILNYFYEFNSIKSANLARRPRGKVLFSKNLRDLKNEYIFLKFVNIFLLLQRTIVKKKIWETIF